LASSTSIFGVPKLSNSAPLIFGKQDHPILCAIFSSQGFGAPSPPLHAYLPRPLAFFYSVSLGSCSILYVFAPLFNFLHLLIDCANPCSKVKPLEVVSSGNRSIQASLVAPLVAGHPCWRGKNE
jgi:hypothetical protein